MMASSSQLHLREPALPEVAHPRLLARGRRRRPARGSHVDAPILKRTRVTCERVPHSPARGEGVPPGWCRRRRAGRRRSCRSRAPRPVTPPAKGASPAAARPAAAASARPPPSVPRRCARPYGWWCALSGTCPIDSSSPAASIRASPRATASAASASPCARRRCHSRGPQYLAAVRIARGGAVPYIRYLPQPQRLGLRRHAVRLRALRALAQLADLPWDTSALGRATINP